MPILAHQVVNNQSANWQPDSVIEQPLKLKKKNYTIQVLKLPKYESIK